MIILGIETSCDETGIALYDSDKGLLADALYSQIELHAEYGGVVPELASRDHIRRVIPLIDEVMQQTKLKSSDIDGIAYTAGPGLMGALLVGSAIGRTLAWAWKIPCVGVNHMEGHLLAPMLEDSRPEDRKIEYPFLALLVSGGHSLLVDVKEQGDYKILGESLDDAVGEAFDKTAKLLGLGYPGGPAISALAETGDSSFYKFPRPMTNRPGLDMSFSGLKTFVLNTWMDSEQTDKNKADIAAAFQEAVVDTLLIKCKRALKETGYKQLVIAGGVSANKQLRESLHHFTEKENLQLFYPDLKFCTDNGAMIAYAGSLRLLKGESENNSFQPKPRWAIDSL